LRRVQDLTKSLLRRRERRAQLLQALRQALGEGAAARSASAEAAASANAATAAAAVVVVVARRAELREARLHRRELLLRRARDVALEAERPALRLQRRDDLRHDALLVLGEQRE